MRATFDADYAQFAGRVRRAVRVAVRREDRVAVCGDIEQATWICYWKYLESGRPVANPVGLLVTIASRRAADHYRLAYVRREKVANPQGPQLVGTMPKAATTAAPAPVVEDLDHPLTTQALAALAAARRIATRARAQGRDHTADPAWEPALDAARTALAAAACAGIDVLDLVPAAARRPRTTAGRCAA